MRTYSHWTQFIFDGSELIPKYYRLCYPQRMQQMQQSITYKRIRIAVPFCLRFATTLLKLSTRQGQRYSINANVTELTVPSPSCTSREPNQNNNPHFTKQHLLYGQLNDKFWTLKPHQQCIILAEWFETVYDKCNDAYALEYLNFAFKIKREKKFCFLSFE